MSVHPQTPPNSFAAAQMQDDVVDLRRLVRLVWRGKWLIGACVAAAVAFGVYYAYVVVDPVYRSKSVIILSTPQERSLSLPDVVTTLTGGRPDVGTQVEVLRARSLVGQVVDRLNLTTDAEFNGELRSPGLYVRLKAQAKALVGVSSAPPSLPAEDHAQRTRDAVISAVLDTTRIKALPQSMVFEITVETQDPRKSARIADAIAAQYIENQITAKHDEAEQTAAWLSTRVARLQESLYEAEARVSAFTARTELVSEDSLRALERQTKDLRDRATAADALAATLNAQIAAMLVADGRKAQAETSGDIQLIRLATRADKDVALAASFDARFEDMIARRQLELGRAKQQMLTLAASKSNLDAAIQRQGQDLITLQQLTREAEAARVLYENFLAQLNTVAARQGLQQADSRVLSAAVVPLRPAAPRKSLILAMAALIGGLAGLGLILARAMGRDTFETAQELEQITGRPVMAQMPHLSQRAMRRMLHDLQSRPEGPLATAVNMLRSSVMLAHKRDSASQIVMLTSALPGEATTGTALALAHGFERLGRRVLFVDTDNHHSTLTAYLPNLPAGGLTEVCTGKATLRQALHRPEGLAMDILRMDRGREASDLLASDAFDEFMEEMRDLYDTIIIAAAPVLVSPDARMVARVADMRLFAVRHDHTRSADTTEALRQMQLSHLSVSGLILSRVKRGSSFGLRNRLQALGPGLTSVAG